MQKKENGNERIDRRTVLKNLSIASVGLSGAVGTSAALPDRKRNRGKGESEEGCQEGDCSDVTGETYVETDDYIYRRIRTSDTDILVKIEIGTGKVTYAKLSTGSDITTQAVGESLKKKTQSLVSNDASVTTNSNATESVSPANIVTNTDGVTAQDKGTIFSRVDVEVEKGFADCGNFLYGEHSYFQVSMELADYDLDDLEDELGYAVVCGSLFALVGSKSSTFKKLLTKISGNSVLQQIPGTICGFIFGTILDGVFDGGSATLAIWDVDEEDIWGTTPYLGFGGDSEYGPDPDDVRDNGPIQKFPTLHTSKLI